MRPDKPTDQQTTPRWWTTTTTTPHAAHEQGYSLLIPTGSRASLDETLSDRLELLFTPDESPFLTRGFSLPLDAGHSRSPAAAYPPHLLRPMRSLDGRCLPRMTEEQEQSHDEAPAEPFCKPPDWAPPPSSPEYSPPKTLTVG
jgi:hypothetical protein